MVGETMVHGKGATQGAAGQKQVQEHTTLEDLEEFKENDLNQRETLLVLACLAALCSLRF